jgi:hypothetical protein
MSNQNGSPHQALVAAVTSVMAQFVSALFAAANFEIVAWLAKMKIASFVDFATEHPSIASITART